MNVAENADRRSQNTALPFDFDRIADRYDSWYHSARGKVYDRIEKTAVSKLLAGIPRGGRLLEVGCGTGHWSRFFRDRGFDVTGVDKSEKMIEMARKKHIPNSLFEAAEGENLPFKDREFDAAAAMTVLEFAMDPERIISEMVRCVKKDKGVLITGVLNAFNTYNQKRKKNPSSVYSSLHLFSPRQMQNLLRPYGDPKMIIAGFVPSRDQFLGLSPLWEYAGRILCPQKGAFIASRMYLWTCRPK
jgi:ubiquinone/menaquinone biosynthesis C-methylase UbiE